jgi:LysM repeat protein
MRKASLFLIAATLPFISFHMMAAEGDLEQEYAQVRKIALKDPKVQEAYRKADERLDEKILQIDPALKPIVDRHAAAPAATDLVGTKSQPAASPAQEGRHHIVVKGETLSSIAEHYKVKVAVIEKVNHIADERKLRVGQNLLIPSSDAPHANTSPDPEPQPGENGGLWDRVKSSL